MLPQWREKFPSGQLAEKLSCCSSQIITSPSSLRGALVVMLILFLFFSCSGQQAVHFRAVLLAERSGGTSAADLLIIVKPVWLQTHILCQIVPIIFYWLLRSRPEFTFWLMERKCTPLCAGLIYIADFCFYWIHLPVPTMSRTHFIQ